MAWLMQISLRNLSQSRNFGHKVSLYRFGRDRQVRERRQKTPCGLTNFFFANNVLVFALLRGPGHQVLVVTRGQDFFPPSAASWCHWVGILSCAYSNRKATTNEFFVSRQLHSEIGSGGRGGGLGPGLSPQSTKIQKNTFGFIVFVERWGVYKPICYLTMPICFLWTLTWLCLFLYLSPFIP